jgi:hypothetical protein
MPWQNLHRRRRQASPMRTAMWAAKADSRRRRPRQCQRGPGSAGVADRASSCGGTPGFVRAAVAPRLIRGRPIFSARDPGPGTGGRHARRVWLGLYRRPLGGARRSQRRSFPSLEQMPLFSASCAALFAALLAGRGALSGYSHDRPRQRPRSGLAAKEWACHPALPRWRSQWQSHVAIPGNAHPPGTLDLRRDGARGLATHRLDRCVELTRSQAALMARNFDYGGRCDRPFLDGSPRRLIPALNPCI